MLLTTKGWSIVLNAHFRNVINDILDLPIYDSKKDPCGRTGNSNFGLSRWTRPFFLAVVRRFDVCKMHENCALGNQKSGIALL